MKSEGRMFWRKALLLSLIFHITAAIIFGATVPRFQPAISWLETTVDIELGKEAPSPRQAIAERPSEPDKASVKTGTTESADKSQPVTVPAQPTSLPVKPVQSTPPPYPVGENDSGEAGTAIIPPRLQYREMPVYPESARSQRREGIVKLRLEILATGKLGRIEIVKSSGDKAMDTAAMQAANRWVFLPARDAVSGAPTTVTTTVLFAFKL